MNLLPIQISDITIGQPLLWDLYNQDQKKLLTRGEVLSNADEELLKKSPLFRCQGEEITPTIKPEPAKSATKKTNQFTFLDMRLKVGDKLLIKPPNNIVSSTTNSALCAAELIGYVNNLSVIIRAPQAAKPTDLSLIEGDQITVQVFSGQFAFSFSSYIEKIINVPFKYIHLSFPSKISGQVIRKSRRIKTNIEANIKDNPAPAIISNLSMTGAEIRANNSLGQIGEIITFSFTVEIHNTKKTLSFQSIIKSIKQAANKIDDTLNFGIEFQTLESEQSYVLQSLIYQELVDNPESHI